MAGAVVRAGPVLRMQEVGQARLHPQVAARRLEELPARALPQVAVPQVPVPQRVVRAAQGVRPVQVGPMPPFPRSVRTRKYQPTTVSSLRS